jgi:hypothetical protein
LNITNFFKNKTPAFILKKLSKNKAKALTKAPIKNSLNSKKKEMLFNKMLLINYAKSETNKILGSKKFMDKKSKKKNKLIKSNKINKKNM